MTSEHRSPFDFRSLFREPWTWAAGSWRALVKPVVVLALAILVPAEAIAASLKVDVPALLRDPKPLVGKQIRLTSLRCANEPNGVFACGSTTGGKRFRVESLALDFQTTAAVRRTLSAKCKSALTAVSSTCVFDAEFSFQSFRTTAPDGKVPYGTTSVSTRRMNLFATAAASAR